MIIIADSGSSKTDWRIVDGEMTIAAIHTIGFNPVLTTAAKITEEVQKSFTNIAINQEISQIFYYGAGCWNVATCTIIVDALQVIFPKASIHVTDDLTGAARSVCGKKAGITCILGTGANSCFFDGKNIVDKIPALGFILGDEGSGAYLGKKLLQHYFYRNLPNELKEKLEGQYSISQKELFANVYNGRKGNRYLAQYAKFVIEEKAHPFMKELISTALKTFIKNQILKYENSAQFPVHFIGSIAFFLKDEIEQIFTENQLQLGKVLQQPIESLMEYHVLNK